MHHLRADVEAIAPKRVEVWYAWTTAIDELMRGRFEGALSPEERARCERFVFERDRRDFVAAHGLMRFALCHSGPYQLAEWQFETTTRGKPSVIRRQQGAPALSMNLTHTRGLVACAVARGMRLGIDVESIGQASVARDVALQHLAPSEVRALDTSEPARYPFQFAELWTLKEAYVKGIGMGLECPFNTFAMRLEPDDGVTLTGDGLEGGWKFLLAAPSPTTRLALAISVDRPEEPCEVALHSVHGAMQDSVVPLRWSPGVSVRDHGGRDNHDEQEMARSIDHRAHP